MIDLANLLLKLHRVFILHVIYDEHGEGSCPEVLYHDILPLHSLDLFRQIRQNIVIHPGIHIPQYRRNQQQYADDKDRNSVLHYFFPKLDHIHLLLFFSD